MGGSARGEGAHGKELCLRFSRTVRRLFLILSYPLPPLLSFSITKGIERHAGKSVSGSPCSHHPCEHRANWVSSESRLRCELPGEGLGDWTVRNHPALLWRCFGAAQGSRTPAARPSFGDRTGDGTACYCTWRPWARVLGLARGPQVGACGPRFRPHPPRARACLGQRGLRACEGQEKVMPAATGRSVQCYRWPVTWHLCHTQRVWLEGALTPPHTRKLHLLNVKARNL